MIVAYITHPVCRLHSMAKDHLECPERIEAIEAGLIDAGLLQRMLPVSAYQAEKYELARVHSRDFIDWIESMSSSGDDLIEIDRDTSMNRYTWDAARYASGSVIQAIDMIMAKEINRAFCNVRPAAHHSGRQSASGFCIFNGIAVGAAHAIAEYGLERIAIVDFDVHHGNGTEEIFMNEPRVMLFDTFEHPQYPGTGATTEQNHIINVPLPAFTDSNIYRELFRQRIIPALEKFRPQLVIFSAGFDAHKDDPLASIQLEADDYFWITRKVIEATPEAEGIISMVAGGYNLATLGECAAAHVSALFNPGNNNAK